MAKRILLVVGIIASSFFGGAIAQIIGGGPFRAAIANITVAFQTSGNLAVSGDNTSAVNSPIWENITASGTASGTTQGINYLGITDTVNAGTNLLNGLLIRHVYGGGNSEGNRFGLMSYFSLNSSPNASDPSIQNYLATASQSFAEAPANSSCTGGDQYTGYCGALWGSYDNTWLASGATNWLSLVGHEIDYAVNSGASVADRYGLVIYAGQGSEGTIDDAEIGLAAGGGLAFYGIEIGGARKNWPIDPNGTVFGAKARTQGGTSSPTALYGLDFSAVTFGAGGAPIVMPQVTPSSSSATCKTGSIEWDANFIYICTATNTFKRAALSTF